MVNYAIMPLFALANAGVNIQGDGQGMSFSTLSTAIVVGLVVGKFIGILLFTLLAVRLKWSDMPEGMNIPNLCGIAMLGGIGFTVSLFIANLSFENSPLLLAEAKLGVVSGTLLAGIAGAIILHLPSVEKRITLLPKYFTKHAGMPVRNSKTSMPELLYCPNYCIH